MKKYTVILMFALFSGASLQAQRVLTLEECRELALQNNKQIAQKRIGETLAHERNRSARTNYLPKIDLVGGYMRSGREPHILSGKQRDAVSNLGSMSVQGIQQNLANAMQQNPALGQMVQGILQKHPELMKLVEGVKGGLTDMGQAIDQLGAGLIDGVRTDTRDVAAAALLLKQPLYMGGKIRAYDRITKAQENIASEQLREEQEVIVLDTEKAYWQTVSLANKLKLAQSYLKTLQHLNSDVEKMIAEGVATKANGLQVAVKLNEADMMVTKVNDGLTLTRMLLCQLCGLPINENVVTIDETHKNLTVERNKASVDTLSAFARRPELKQLAAAKDIYRQKIKITRSDFLPHVALVGGYGVTYPNIYNGFERKWRGDWHVGLTLKVPVWNWMEGRSKVRMAKAESAMTDLKLLDAREKIALQVAQETFRVNESNKRLVLAEKNLSKANENLRVATLGYKEGVIPMVDVLEAETAWLKAHSEKIDAEINTKLTRAAWRKAVGGQP